MCLALIAVGQHPRYPIIILSNRDKFYNRPTAPADYWLEYPQIFAGKDLLAGGTWFGVNKNGNFALLTNYRNPDSNHLLKKSRGLLAKHFLEQDNILPSDYVNTLTGSAAEYSPFNLIVGNTNEIIYYSNVTNQITRLPPGIYCLSNHLLTTPWPKTIKAASLFQSLHNALIACNEPLAICDLLFPILEDNTRASDNALPQTGIPFEWEKSLSSIFVTTPTASYGTRSSTIALIEKNNIVFSEKIFLHGKKISLQTTHVC